MSIQFNSNAPDDIQHKLTGWIPTFEQAAADLGLPEDVEFTLSQGYQVNYPSIRQIESGQLLCGSRRSSWRFMVFGSNQLIGEIELDDQHNPVTFYQGAGKEGLLSALTQAEAETDEYQFSLILVCGYKAPTKMWWCLLNPIKIHCKICNNWNPGMSLSNCKTSLQTWAFQTIWVVEFNPV